MTSERDLDKPSLDIEGGSTRHDHLRNVLFLCTDNAARSLMAEALLRHWGRGRFQTFSAGNEPAASPHPLTLQVIGRAHLPTAELSTKNWSVFAGSDAPVMDFVVTLCPLIATATSPEWPGHPLLAHWGIGDPTAASGVDREPLRAFDRAYRETESRVKLFVSLPLGSLDRLTLSSELRRLE